jgi:hypothetical protein
MGKSYQLLNMRTCTDANNQGYIQSTFKTEIKCKSFTLALYYYNYISVGCEFIDFDEDLAEFTKDILIQREKKFEHKFHLAKHQFGFLVLNVKLEQIRTI